MYPGESRIYFAILTAVGVLMALLCVLFVTIIRYHRKKIAFQRQRVKVQFTSIENERARIAKDLHDDLGASLSAVKLRLQCLEPDNQNNILLVEQSEAYIDEAMDKLRRISFDVMPQALQRKGLKDALNELIEKLIPDNRIEIKYECEVNVVNKEKRIHIYRIVQELMNNIIKHSGASVVHLSLKVVKNKIRLCVKDNGVGFERNGFAKKGRGQGLHNITARGELLNAKIHLTTKPGKGTHYLIEIPFQCSAKQK